MIIWKVKEREMDKTLLSTFQLQVSALSNNNNLETYLNVELTSKCTCPSHFNVSTGKIIFLHPTFIARDFNCSFILSRGLLFLR